MDRLNVANYIEQFKVEYQFRLAPRTIQAYQLAVRQLHEQVNTPFEQITKKDIRNWLLILEEKGYKPTTIRSMLTGLKSFYNYCLEEGIVPSNPTSGIPFFKIPQTVPKYLEKTELNRLRACVEGHLSERAIIEVLFSTGVRISELVAMRIEDINWSERSLLIPEGKGKKGRIVLFSLECLHHLKAHLANRTDSLPFVFINESATGSIRTQKVTTRFQSYSKELGFKVTAHTLRHTFTAHLAQKGMPLESIQQLLGHDSPHTTQLYAHLYNHARKELYDKWT